MSTNFVRLELSENFLPLSKNGDTKLHNQNNRKMP